MQIPHGTKKERTYLNLLTEKIPPSCAKSKKRIPRTQRSSFMVSCVIVLLSELWWRLESDHRQEPGPGTPQNLSFSPRRSVSLQSDSVRDRVSVFVLEPRFLLFGSLSTSWCLSPRFSRFSLLRRKNVASLCAT